MICKECNKEMKFVKTVEEIDGCHTFVYYKCECGSEGTKIVLTDDWKSEYVEIYEHHGW